MRQNRGWFTAAAVLTLLLVQMSFTASMWAASTYKVLHEFTGPDGDAPNSGVVLDAAGNIYGTAAYGGNSNCNPPAGCGTVFKIDVKGTFTVLVRFGGIGRYPNSAPVLDAQNNLYGTSRNGGPDQEGSIFKVSPSGKLTLLYSSVVGADGFPPLGVVLDPAGNLYGTTLLGGGVCPIGSSGCGTVYKLDPNGNKTQLYSFTDGADGGEPNANVIRDAAGNLYGTAFYGGDLSCFENIGCGTVYKLDTNNVFTVLKTFTGTDGQFPGSGSLVLDAAGNLYGATLSGGSSPNCNGGCGVVFKLTPKSNGTWVYTIIHSFASRPSASPLGGMVFDSAGNLYGTSNGGTGGMVFKLAPQANGSWAYSVIHVFQGTPALNPNPGLAIDKAGNLYGTAQSCSNSTVCQGVVFEITP